MSKRFFNTVIGGLAVVILLAIFLKTIGLFDSRIKTYPATLGKLEINLEKEALVFRDELILSANVEGKVDFLVEEAQRVYAGQTIATITPMTVQTQDSDGANGEEGTKKDQLEFSQYMVDIDTIRSNIKSLEDELSYLVKQNKYAEIADVEDRLSSFYLVQRAYDQQGGIMPSRTTVSASIEGGRYVVTAPKAGLIGLETSPFDQLFSVQNMHLIQYSTLPELPSSHVRREVKNGDIFLRIVDNKESYLVVNLTPEEMSYFKVGNLSEVIIGEDRMTAEIYQLVRTEQQTGIVFRLFEDYPKMTEYRHINVQLIPEKTEGILIKSSSILEEEGQMGVKVLSPSGVVRFVPIKIKARIGDEAVIHSDFYTLSKAEGTNESIKTVNLYDEILEEP